MTFNDFLDRFLRVTLWIWLPFHVLPGLLHDAKEKFERSRRKRRTKS